MATKTGMILAATAAAAFLALSGCASQQSGAHGPYPHLAGKHACKGMASCKGMHSCKSGCCSNSR